MNAIFTNYNSHGHLVLSMWLSGPHPVRDQRSRQTCSRLCQQSVRFRPLLPSCHFSSHSLSFLFFTIYYYLLFFTTLTTYLSSGRACRGVRVTREAGTNSWIKVMVWPWSFLSDDPQQWPRQSSARFPFGKKKIRSAWGEKCAPLTHVFAQTLYCKHTFTNSKKDVLPQAKTHRDQHIEPSFPVSAV